MLLIAGCSGAVAEGPREDAAGDEASVGDEAESPSEAMEGSDDASIEGESREPEAATSAPTDPEAAALAEAFVARLTVWTRADGTRVLSRRCREGPVDCRARLAAFAGLIVEVARRHELDPLLLAALAMHESGLNPAALGRRREAGIVQLHPRGAGRDVRYVQDAAYRERCQSEVDACQEPVLERGATTLARTIEECGSLVSGLGAYASGHCTERGVHPGRVIAERARLRALVGGD